MAADYPAEEYSTAEAAAERAVAARQPAAQ